MLIIGLHKNICVRRPCSNEGQIERATYLVEEHILSVTASSCIRLKSSVWTDTMFQTQLLPEFHTDCIDKS